MSVKKRALGRGLDALLGAERPASGESGVAVAAAPPSAASPSNVPFARLKPNPYQPRQHFIDDALEELSASIREHGILQPIIVRRSGEDFEIVAGERRWRAAQRAGLQNVPIVVREFDNRQMLELSLIENLQREDLNPIEEALAYLQLVEDFHLTQDQVADRVGKSRVTITNSLRLLKLPRQIRDWMIEKRITAGHARALLALENETAQLALAREIMSEGLNVRQVERRVRQLIAKPRTTADGKEGVGASAGPGRQTADLEEKLSLKLGQKVRIISEANNRGRVEIYYSSLDEFQGLMERLGIPVEQDV